MKYFLIGGLSLLILVPLLTLLSRPLWPYLVPVAIAGGAFLLVNSKLMN